MSVSCGKAGYLCSQPPPQLAPQSSQVGWAELWFPGPLGSVAAFPSSSLVVSTKEKREVGTSTHFRGFTRLGLAAVSDPAGHCEKPLVIQMTFLARGSSCPFFFLVNSCFLRGKRNLSLPFPNISF